MKIADKYILRQLIVGFLLVLTCMTMLVWLTQSLRMIDMIVTNGVSVGVFLKMSLLVLPHFMQILMPLALFAVVLFVFIRMQSDKELMVLKAVGMGPYQLMRPVLKMAGVLVIIGYFLSLFLVPWSENQVREMKWKVRNNLSHVMLQEGQFNTFKKGMMIYIRERMPNGAIKGILAYEMKDGKKSTLIADEGTLYQSPDGIEVVFGQGARQEYNPETKQYSVLKFDKYTVALNDKNQSSGTRTQKVKELPFTQLLTMKRDEAPNESTWRKYKVEAFKRLTQPLYSIIFALLALVGVITGYYNRRGQPIRVNAVVGSALLIQTLALAFENIAGKNLWGLLLMTLNIVLPLWIMVGIFKKESGPKVPQKYKYMLRFVFMFGLLFSVQSYAFSDIDTSAFNKDQPVDFEADHVSYDQKQQTMTASGNVVLKQNGIVFNTDKILYNQKSDMIHIPGEATMVLPDGNSSVVRDIQIKAHGDEVKTGKGKMDMADGTHLWANQIVRQDGKENILKDAFYTPCEMCENSSPLWQIHASSIEQDEESHMMRFWNTRVELKNVPVLYFPYFQIPDYTVKRQTGFLTPTFGSDSELKAYVKAPIFVDLAENQNLTITPVVSFSRNPLGILDYQGLFSKGKVELQTSYTKDDDDRKQGHIQSSFEYDINDSWRLTGGYNRTITDTYFRRYNVLDVDTSQSFLTSHLTGEYYGNRLYGNATLYNFQSLQEGVRSESIPVILPVFNMRYTTKPFTQQGGIMYSDINGAFINDRNHFKSNRLSLTQGISLPYKTSFGLMTQLSGSVRMDGYSVDTGLTDIGPRAQDSYFTGRVFPQAVLKISYPLIKKNAEYAQVLEPIVMMVASPNGSNPDKIPNVDSSVFDFDDVNLFSPNRYMGYDKVESGSRINYGVQWTLYQTDKKRSIQALLGQSIRLREKDELDDAMGYDGHFSSYVGRLQLNYDYLTLAYRFRMAQESFEAQKNDISVEAGSSPLRIGLNYLFQDSFRFGDVYSTAKKEVSVYVRSRLTKNWSLEGRYRYNLLKSDRGPLETYGILRYDNECAAVEFEASKSYTHDRNYKGDTSITMRFYLKTLGGFGQ